MAKDKVDYDFELVTSSDYKCVFTYWSDNNFLMSVFNVSKGKVARKVGVPIDSKFIDDVDSFDVESRFYGYLRTVISKHIKEVYSIVGRDKVVLMNDKVSSAKFKRGKDRNWFIYITIEGQYVDKR